MNAIYPDLKGKVILVTGATRGLGKAIVRNLAHQKAHVVFNYREGNSDIANQLKTELLELGANGASALPFDLCDTEKMKTEVEKFIQEVGPISGLVNNAGISKDQIILRLKKEDVLKTLETNLVGAMMLTQILSRSFLKSTNVSVVNISSIVGLMGNASQISYAASKAGLIGFTKSYAKELASRNIRANAICPGFIATDMTHELEENVQKKYLETIPLARFGEGKEVSELVAFLLSQSSSYITGETIKIDGGLYI